MVRDFSFAAATAVKLLVALWISLSLTAPVHALGLQVDNPADMAVWRGEREKALELYLSQCDGGDARGCYFFGALRSWMYGEKLHKNTEARRYLSKSCEMGFYWGCRGLQKMISARRVGKEACEQGDSDVCRNLGGLMSLGEGGDADPEFGKALYARADELNATWCQNGVASACHRAAVHIVATSLKQERLALARRLFEIACEGGNPSSCRELATMLRRGEGGVQDNKAARAYDELACGKGTPCKKVPSWFAGIPRPSPSNVEPSFEISPSEALAAIFGTVLLFKMLEDQANAPTTNGAPSCGQEFNIVPASRPCGNSWRSWDKWNGDMWCYSSFRHGNKGATFCTDGKGTWAANGLTSPCNGAEGWCDGVGLGPKPGFLQ